MTKEDTERFVRMETMLADIHKGWNNGGSPAVQRLKSWIEGLMVGASVIVIGLTGWLGWLTLQIQNLS